VQWALSAVDGIRVPRRSAESLATAMKQDAAVRRNDTATEIAEKRVDEGDGKPILVDHRQINRIGLRAERSFRHEYHPSVAGNLPRELFDIIRTDQAGVADIHMTRIGYELVPHRVGDPGRFHFQMEAFCTKRIKAFQIERFKYPKHDKSDHALTVGRQLGDRVPLVVPNDR